MDEVEVRKGIAVWVLGPLIARVECFIDFSKDI